MKKLNRLLALILLIIFALQIGAAAEEGSFKDKWLSDLDYTEKIYEYDFNTVNGDSEESEQKKVFPKEISAVLALKLMSLLPDGTFGEGNTVPANELAITMARFIAYNDESLEGLYSSYGEKTPVTHFDVVKLIVNGLGYEVMTKESSYEQVAQRIKLLRNVSYQAQKYITRHELAHLIYNALEIDIMVQTAFSDNPTYVIEKGTTILSENLKAVKLTGVVTAENGTDIYSTVRTKEGIIHIDRAPYYTGDVSVMGLLGHRVFGYAVKDIDNEKYTLLSLEIEENDDALIIETLKISDIRDNRIYYSNGSKDVSASISGVKNVLYNNEIAGREQLAAFLKDYEGSIMLSSSSTGSKHDIAIINVYQSFVIAQLQLSDDRITLKNDMTFDGSNQINIDESAATPRRVVSVTKDGKAISLADLKAGQVISVNQNASRTNLNIMVSDRKLSGKITGTTSDGFTDEFLIDQKPFKVSKSYYLSREIKTDLKKMEVGDIGEFYLSHDNYIVDFNYSDINEYGYLRDIAKDNKTVDRFTKVKLFTRQGNWEIYNFAQKLELDGVNVTADQAYTSMSGYSENIRKTIVRYRLNSNDEIVFFDTIHDSAAEIADNQQTRVKPPMVWTGLLDWTVGFSEITNLENSVYKVKNGMTTIFSIPADEDKENLYKVVSPSSMKSKTTVVLHLYCWDEFRYSRAALLYPSSATSEESNVDRIIVNKLVQALDEDENIGTKIDGIQTSGTTWYNVSYFITEDLLNGKLAGVKSGDVLSFEATTDGILRAASISTNIESWSKKYVKLGGYVEQAWGTVSKLDIETNRIMLSVGTYPNGDDFTNAYYPESIAIYDSKRGSAVPATLSDLHIGDVIYGAGGTSFLRMIVFR